MTPRPVPSSLGLAPSVSQIGQHTAPSARRACSLPQVYATLYNRMRSVARRSSRLPSCERASFTSQRRFFQQGFRRQVTDPRTPNPREDTEQDRQDAASEKSKTGANGISGETEAPQEQRRSSFRKPLLRQKRVAETPSLPPLPQWFLDSNLKLYSESPVQPHPSEGTQMLVAQSDRTKPGKLFSIPHYTHPGAESKDPANRLDEPRPGFFTSLQVDAEDATAAPSSISGKNADQEQPAKLPPIRDLVVPKEKPNQTSTTSEGLPIHETLKTPHSKSADKIGDDLMSFSFLELEAGVRAGLSMSERAEATPSFVTDRVDISVQCTDRFSFRHLNKCVKAVARNVGADLVRIDANDFSDLLGDHLGQGEGAVNPYANLSYDVFEGWDVKGPRPRRFDRDDVDEDEDEDERDDGKEDGRGVSSFPHIGGHALDAIRRSLGGRMVEIGFLAPFRPSTHQSSAGEGLGTRDVEQIREDARLTSLIEQLIDAPKHKSSNGSSSARSEATKLDVTKGTLWQEPREWLPHVSRIFADYLTEAFASKSWVKLTTQPYEVSDIARPDSEAERSTIVQIQDLRDIYEVPLGKTIISRLVNIVQQRRRAGERIIVVGTTVQDVTGPIQLHDDAREDFPFRQVYIPPEYAPFGNRILEIVYKPPSPETFAAVVPHKMSKINLRHIESMMRKLRPGSAIDFRSLDDLLQVRMPGTVTLAQSVLSFDQIQRLLLTAIGLSYQPARSDVVRSIHIALANFVISRADSMLEALTNAKEQTDRLKSYALNNRREHGKHESLDAHRLQVDSEKLKKNANQHEARLMSGVIDPNRIKVSFSDVHVPQETIDAMKTVTSLSLLRPDAFKYGVLAKDRLTGLLLYGPPGTGKTLLAKALARDAGAKVMEVSGAQIYEKYVGEGEKMVRAVFSLAKKLSPCIVFLDEADAIFGSRSNAGNRNTHRDIINQFLREWDGMDDHGVFIMVASNRPFDLDDAVLRRLPRRLLVDLPTVHDRESILKIHLRDELLDPSISLSKLAERTPMYSGSDLKNLAVAAALAAVREENAKRTEDPEFQYPEKRTLTPRHFDIAMNEISASISEDMPTLNAIRRFDEQFGNRRGKRKKTGYGFGAADATVNEATVRVRDAGKISSEPGDVQPAATPTAPVVPPS